jgi:hypothetical protein
MGNVILLERESGNSAIRGDGEAGRIPGGSVLASFLTTDGGTGWPPILITLSVD